MFNIWFFLEKPKEAKIHAYSRFEGKAECGRIRALAKVGGRRGRGGGDMAVVAGTFPFQRKFSRSAVQMGEKA
jgi:hypothetical protein